MKAKTRRIYYEYHKENQIPDESEGYVFVFGSNDGGNHGAGEALIALKDFGAESYRTFGHMGNAFAIPTRDRHIRSLSLNQINLYVQKFKEYTHKHPELKFWVTSIGGGRLGYKPRSIAPLFRGCNSNCSFNDNWKPYLTNLSIDIS